MTQFTIMIDPVEVGSDGTYGWEDWGDDIVLNLDPSYSDKVEFSFKSVLNTELVQPAEWLRVAKNVAQYNKEMYLNWVFYFHKLLHTKLDKAMVFCNPKDHTTLVSIYRLIRSVTFEDLVLSCQLFIKHTKDKSFNSAIDDLRDDIQTIFKNG